MNTQTVTQPTTALERSVLQAVQDNATKLYHVTLSDPEQIVETEDKTIAQTAERARQAGKRVSVDLEPGPNGRQRIVELMIVATTAAAAAVSSVPATVTKPAAAAPTSTAMTKAPALPTGLINKPELLTEQLSKLAQHYHVMSPAIAVADMAPGYGANLALVKIDSAVTIDQYGNGQGADCYFSKSLHKDSNKRSFNKQGVIKIGQAAGVQWIPGQCRRTDDGKQRNYWAWTFTGAVRTHDGQITVITGSRELDLREGAAEAVAMRSADQLAKARAMGNELCETKAMLRALRTLGIRPSYTVEELEKPFLIVRFSFTPDMSDPAIKALVTERAMGSIGQLYSPPPVEMPALAAAPPVGQTTPIALEDDATESAAASTAKDDRPIGGLKVVEAVKFDGMSKAREGKPSKPYTKYTVTFDTGESGVTFSATIFETALKAKKSGQWVKAHLEENPNPEYTDGALKALEILDGSQPDLPIAGEKL